MNIKKITLKQLIKARVMDKGGKIPKRLRQKIGRGLMVYAALPLFSAWAFIPGYILMMPLSPTLWAKDKIRYFKEWRLLR